MRLIKNINEWVMNLMEQPQTHKNDPYNPDIFDQNIQNKHLELFKPYRVPRERCCQSLFGCTNKIAFLLEANKCMAKWIKRYCFPTPFQGRNMD